MCSDREFSFWNCLAESSRVLYCWGTALLYIGKLRQSQMIYEDRKAYFFSRQDLETSLSEKYTFSILYSLSLPAPTSLGILDFILEKRGM